MVTSVRRPPPVVTDKSWEPVFLVWGGALGLGGTETRMLEVIRSWSGVGNRSVVSIMPARSRGSLLARSLVDAGSDIVHVEGVRSLLRAVVGAQASFVLCFGLRASLTLRPCKPVLAARRIRLLEARNGLESSRSEMLWRVDRFTSGAVNRFVVNSDAVREQLVGRGFRSDRVTVLRSAVREEWIGAAGSPRDPSRVVMVGNARPEKNQAFGLRALAATGVPMDVVVFTDDASALRAVMKAMADASEMRVTFVEGQTVTPSDLDDRGLLFHPSLSESLPRAVIEAKARGLRVVATDVGDTAGLLSGDDHLVPPGDFKASVEVLRRATQRPGFPSVPDTTILGVDQYASALLDLCQP